MPSFEDELRMDEEENRREIAYIRERLPQELKTYFSDDEDIDLQQVADAVVAQAEKDKAGTFDPEAVYYVVEADLDFQEQNV